jgi:hypothetical protein
MTQALEPLESTYAPWVSSLVAASVVLALLTFLMSLNAALVGKALPLGIAALAVAVAARIMAQIIGAHRAGATVAVVIGIISLGSGLQSALLGTGQVI